MRGYSNYLCHKSTELLAKFSWSGQNEQYRFYLPKTKSTIHFCRSKNVRYQIFCQKLRKANFTSTNSFFPLASYTFYLLKVVNSEFIVTGTSNKTAWYQQHASISYRAGRVETIPASVLIVTTRTSTSCEHDFIKMLLNLRVHIPTVSFVAILISEMR